MRTAIEAKRNVAGRDCSGKKGRPLNDHRHTVTPEPFLTLCGIRVNAAPHVESIILVPVKRRNPAE